ncbi:MAG: hypothetical protein ACFCVC_04355 [Acidimicrobiia bacterium]
MTPEGVLEPLGSGGLDQVLTDLARQCWTGSIRFAGPDPTSLFFDDGRLYFAVSGAQALTAQELATAGIDHRLWQEAGGRPGAKGKFAEELLDLGCDRRAVERFVDARLAASIATLRASAVDGYTRSSGRHGFGAAIAFEVERYLPEASARFADDTLISLDRDVTSPVTLDAATWNALAGLVAPMRFAELSDVLGASAATSTVGRLERLGVVSIVSSHTAGDEPDEPAKDAVVDDLASSGTQGDRAGTSSDRPIPSNPFKPYDADDDYEEYVPERVGRQTYAAIASMRANRAEPPPQEKAHALRRLIEAVRGL